MTPPHHRLREIYCGHGAHCLSSCSAHTYKLAWSFFVWLQNQTELQGLPEPLGAQVRQSHRALGLKHHSHPWRWWATCWRHSTTCTASTRPASGSALLARLQRPTRTGCGPNLESLGRLRFVWPLEQFPSPPVWRFVLARTRVVAAFAAWRHCESAASETTQLYAHVVQCFTPTSVEHHTTGTSERCITMCSYAAIVRA